MELEKLCQWVFICKPSSVVNSYKNNGVYVVKTKNKTYLITFSRDGRYLVIKCGRVYKRFCLDIAGAKSLTFQGVPLSA